MITTAAPVVRDNPAVRVLWRSGGASLLAGTALFFGGSVTAPPQDTDSTADYIASLARNPLLTEVSAMLLHYGNLLIGVGVLVLPMLVRGRRGALATLIGTLMMVLGFLNTSGAVLSDWWNMELGRQLPMAQAVPIAEGALGHPLLQLWTAPQMLALLGVIVTLAGLARAGVLGWWTVPVPVVCFAAAFILPLSMPLLISAVIAAAFAPLAAAGLLALRRPAPTA